MLFTKNLTNIHLDEFDHVSKAIALSFYYRLTKFVIEIFYHNYKAITSFLTKDLSNIHLDEIDHVSKAIALSFYYRLTKFIIEIFYQK